jgi:hypothetical protein
MLSLCITPWRRMKECRYSTFLTSALDGGKRSASRPGRFIPEERGPGTNSIGGWVGLRACLEAMEKRNIIPYRESNTRSPSPQSVAIRLSYPENTLSFLCLPLQGIGHPWNASFHFSFLIVGQSVGLLERGISPSQGRYLYKHRINADRHRCLEWDSNHDPSVRADDDSSCPRTRGHCDRPKRIFPSPHTSKHRDSKQARPDNGSPVSVNP